MSNELTLPKKTLFDQFISYALAGAVGTFLQYLILFLLVEMFSVYPVTASILGMLAGAVVNYLLNYHWVFQSKRRHSETLSKFFATGGVGWALNAVIMYVLVTIASIHYLLAQVVATGIVLFWNFLGNRLWTFAGDARNN